MFGIENLPLFIGTGILLNLYPGPDNIYILSRSISQGRGAGVAAALGISLGAIGHTILAAFGLSAILAASSQAFMIMKILGCCYLLYQGIMMILPGKSNQLGTTGNISKSSLKTIFKQGAITNLLNPKVALFFLALLPQFINPQSSSKPLAFLVLGATFITTGTIVCLAVALSAASISKKLRDSDTFSRWLLKINGALFIFLGLKLATFELDDTFS